MDNNDWRPSSNPNVEPAMNTSDWRTQLPPDSRPKVINKIMDTLKKHIPFSGPEGINELRRIAIRFEEKIFVGAVSQTDYLRKISIKMLNMETKSQNAAGSSSSIPAANNGTSMESMHTNPGNILPGTLPTNQSQSSQPLMSQTMQSNISSRVTGSTGLPSSMPPVSSITNNNVPSGINQDSSGQHGHSSNMFSGSQRQMLGRQHAIPSQQPQSAQYLYQQQLQQQLLKRNFQSGNVLNPNSLLPSSQQPGIPTYVTQSSAVSLAPVLINQQSSSQLSAQQATTQAMHRQHQSSLLRQNPASQQASGIHQQQTSLPQQSISPLQHQQAQMMRQQAANSSGIQQKLMQQQHQQRLLNQQNNIMNIQRQQKQQPPAQQQLMSQQNNLQATHQQPLGTQSNVSGMQQPQQQLHGSQVGNSNLQNMLSQPTVGLQRTHQAGHGTSPSQGQQSQNPLSQQQMMPLQSHQEQLGSQQQPNLLQQDMQQRLQSSGQVTGSLLPPHNAVDQQRQLYQSQRAHPEMPSSSLDSTAETEDANGVDWQEEIFQKIQPMKAAYLSELHIMYQKVAAKFQQDSLPEQHRSDHFERLKQYKALLERMIQFLSFSKNNITPGLKDKVDLYEKRIINFLKTNGPKKPVQQPQPQPQTVRDQSHDSQTNPQMQSVSMPGSGPRAHQSSLTNMQSNVLSSRPGVSAPRQNIPSSIPASSLESGHGNALNNSQQGAMGSTQQNTSQVNTNSVSAQSGLSSLQPNVNQTQLSSSLLQKQQDQQMSQQFRQQLQQRQMQKQQLQKLQARQQAAQNDLTGRQGMNVSQGMFQQHSLQGQRANYPLQQSKPGSQLGVSSPQLSQGASPQTMGTPLQPANSPFVVPSPSTPLAQSPMQVDSEKPSGTNIARQQATGMQGVVQSVAIATPGISASPLLQEFTSSDGNNISISGKPNATELPIERLIRAMKSASPQALSSAISDMGSVVSMVDRIAGSAPGKGYGASVGEDLVAMTKSRLQTGNFMTQEGMVATKKRKCHITAMPLSIASPGGSVSDNYKLFACSETSDMELTATSGAKKARTKMEHTLLEEIKEINQRLIDTVVEISEDEDASDPSEGTTVKFSFVAVSLSRALKAHLSSTQMSPIQPLRLLVPCSYPNGSPSLLDNPPFEISKEKEDLSSKAMARFNISLRSLSQPMSLKDIAKAWDACARTVICEYTQQFGGGTFSSKHGAWENLVAAS